MNKFRTEFQIPEADNKIDYNSQIMMMGSCFSQNIGEKLSFYKFTINSNPFGVLYNPYSIQEAFRIIFGERKLSDDDLVFHEGLYQVP